VRFGACRKRVRGRSTKYPNETLDERKARQRFATKQRVQKSRLRQKEMKALAAIQMQRAQESNCVRCPPLAPARVHTGMRTLNTRNKPCARAELN